MPRFTWLAAIALVVASIPAIAGLPKSQCPQPRFTGQAPEADYNRVNPLPDDAATRRAGEKLFLGKDGHFGCANCHGEKGGGNGPLASQFNPPPRNFACAKTVNGIPDGQLAWIIRNGSPGTAMPAHKDYTDEQVWQLVTYLRTLAKR